MRKQITDAVRAAIAGNPELQFKVLPDLISGIELNANGRKIAWSFESYLSSLEEEMAKAIEEGTREQEPVKSGKIKKAEKESSEKTDTSDARDERR
jgi:F-type H+-transporting ATPase subunit b